MYVDMSFPITPVTSRVGKPRKRGGEEEGVSIVLLVGSPDHAERAHADEELAAELGDVRPLAVGNVDGERAFRWVVVVGCSPHLAAFVVDLLASSSEGIARDHRVFVE